MKAMYCPTCYSLLYPVDEESMRLIGVCSYCSTYEPKYRDALATKKKNLKKRLQKEKSNGK